MSLYASLTSNSGMHLRSDVNSIGGGVKPSLHVMGWAISLVGGASPICEDEQI